MLVKADKKRKRPSPWGQINIANTETLNNLKNIHPKYAEHMFRKNHLVEIFAREKFGGVDVLDLPMCERCERPGAWHDGDTCYCFPCGHTTPKEHTKPLRDWLAQDIQEFGLSEEQLKLLEMVSSKAFEKAIADMIENIDTEYKEDENETTDIDTTQE